MPLFNRLLSKLLNPESYLTPLQRAALRAGGVSPAPFEEAQRSQPSGRFLTGAVSTAFLICGLVLTYFEFWEQHITRFPGAPWSQVVAYVFRSNWPILVVTVFMATAGAVGLIYAISPTSEFGDEGTLANFATFPQPAERSHEPLLLRPTATRRSVLVTVLVLTLVWTGLIAGLLFLGPVLLRNFVFEVNLSGLGEINLFVVPWMIAFGFAGILGILFIRALVVSTVALTNPTPMLTMTPGFVRVGDELTLDWRIDGRARSLRNLQINLEGREEATYQVKDYGRSYFQYRDRTVKHVFANVALIDEQGIVSEAGSLKIALPRDMMHSFDGRSNKVTWVLVVHSDVAYRPGVNDEFPLKIAPIRAGRS
jgi:hypothetical protein